MAKDKGFGKKWKGNQDRLGVFSPLEKGDYKAVIKSASTGPTKAKDGKVLAIKYEIVSGDDKGRTFSEFLTYEHQNPTTEEISAQHIASLCDAVGIEFEELERPSEFVGKKVTLTLGITPGNDEYGPGNKVTAYNPFKSKSKDEDEDEDEEKPKKDKKKKDKKKKKGEDKPF